MAALLETEQGVMMARPRFVWSDVCGEGRNVFVLFRRVFTLAAVPRTARIHLFADTRYRLRVNGEVAAYGPARFVPAAPEADTVEIARYLVPGRNVITVEVNSKGDSSFDSLPSVGGFIAWGTIRQLRGIGLTTPGEWQARRADAWDQWAPPCSFAQGPTEIVDLRALPAEWFSAADDGSWSAPVVMGDQQAWGKLRPRSIPMLAMDERLPEKTLLLAPLEPAELTAGCRVPGDASEAGQGRLRACYAACLYSPREQDVTLGLFWGPHYLNGGQLKPVKTARLGDREDFPVHLRQGWYFLYGEPEKLATGWGILIGLPAGKGLALSAEERLDAPHTLLYTGPVHREELDRVRKAAPCSMSELPAFSTPWLRAPRGVRPPIPAREMAWDVPGAQQPLDSFVVSELRLPASPAGATALFDFDGEFIGHVVLDIEAPAGAVVDVANGETLRADGMLDLFRSHWGVNTADRFIVRGGRERIEGFHPRGGRYLQVTVRDADGPVTLHRVAIRETTYPLKVEGRFACSDPFFNWLWDAAEDTLRACMEDAYLDCPWRERGCYVGDSLVEYHMTRALTADAALARRCLWLWGVAQRPDGQMQDVVPSWHDAVLGDYTLLWVVLLRDYWASTGDKALVRELWPCLKPLFASPLWVETESGLWDGSKACVGLDWGATDQERVGESGALNAFRFRAVECATELAAALGKRAEAARYSKEAARVKAAFQTLWDEQRGRFAATRVGGKLIDAPALHANALALAYGLATRNQTPSVLRYVAEGLEANTKLQPGHFEPYFLYFVLGALYDHGMSAVAEQAIRSNYGLMRNGGAWTLWEMLSPANSLCHAWSGAPLHFFAERTLGVRQGKAGKPDDVLIAPDSATLQWAFGIVPHRRGPVAVSWRVQAGALWVDVLVPRGVRLKVKPAGALAGLPVHVNARR
ncbi:MAG: family 78 glycoside hydrolase catalytic domain [Planctomycetota bacterium]|nr:family 78 glycoside hydrolase catalytic domain [Planctomycetota bacterium]